MQPSVSLPDTRVPLRVTAPAIVWTVWGAMAAALVGCIAYTFNIPIAEDWHLVRPMVGQEPQLWTWLWEQNNEHRLPLPRLILLGVLLVTEDFRAGMLVNVLVMAAAAAIVLRALAALRGGSLRWTDAFVPIALLHIGNWENFMWAWQLCFVLSAALCLVLLAALADRGFWSSRWRPAAAGVTLAALPLCGANGLAFAAPVCAWLGVEALIVWRQGRLQRAPAVAVFGGLGVALAGALYYFVGYTSASWNPETPGVMATLKTTVKFLALGFGPAALQATAVFSLALVAILSAAGLLTMRAMAVAAGDERLRAWRLISYAAGLLVLAFAFGWGRAGLVPALGLPDRYVLLAAPALVWSYVVLEVYGRSIGRVAQAALLVLACALLPANTADGFAWRDWYRDGMQQVTADLEAGAPRDQLVERHGRFLMHWSPDRLGTGMELLRNARIGPFAQMP